MGKSLTFFYSVTHHGDEVAVLGSGDLAAEDEGAAVPVDVAEVLTILRTRRLHLINRIE
jgi:hypothetical protein